ncbi:MAG: MbnP family protein [Flammeovirgaceae bacterium]
MQKTFFILLILATTLFSCEDDAVQTGEMEFVFRNKFRSLPLATDVAQYANSLGEEFVVSTLSYYVSNFELVKDDGSVYTIPQEDSYFLIRDNDLSTSDFSIKNIPVGNYTALRFTIGVDRERSMANVEERQGVLDVVENSDMYWVWNSGYIFMKLEGTSSAAPVSGSGERNFRYHIGGFGGYDSETVNNIRTTEVNFDNTKAIVTEEKIPRLIIAADLSKFFDGTTNLSIAEHPNVMLSEKSTEIADNYKNMFVFDHLHNY